MIKYFRFSLNYVLWEISWANLIMLSASIPKYDADKNDDRGHEVRNESELLELLG